MHQRTACLIIVQVLTVQLNSNNTPVSLFLQAFDDGPLEKYRPYFAGGLDLIRDMPMLVYLILFTPVMIIILVIVLRYSLTRVRV